MVASLISVDVERANLEVFDWRKDASSMAEMKHNLRGPQIDGGIEKVFHNCYSLG